MSTLKQRLDNRNSLTPLEYIQASLSLLDDSTAYQPQDKDYIYKHTLYVATDALSRPWPAVRKWSQTIWDCVDRGRCVWSDSRFIQEERIRVSYTSGPSSSSTNPQKPNSWALRETLCRDFNSVGGCKHHGPHEQGEFRLLHACAFCDSMGRRSNHSFQRCRSLMEQQPPAAPGAGSVQGHNDSRQWNLHHRPGYNYNANNTNPGRAYHHGQQQPKN